MPPRKRPKTAPAPRDTPAAPAKEDGVEDVVELRLGGTLAAALAAPHLTVTAMGSGGLAVPIGTGELDGVEDATLASAVEYALRTPPATAKSKKDGREPTCEEKPFVAEPKKLGEGAPASFLDGASASDVATRRRADRWTPRELEVFLQTRFQLQRRRGSRPKCCFCQSMLTYITATVFERALFRQAYGPMWLADGDIVLVSRPLMEAAANRAARALLKRRWSRTTVINPRTNDREGFAKHVGQTKFPSGGDALRKADCGIAPPRPPPEKRSTKKKEEAEKSAPEQFYWNAKTAKELGFVGRAFADLSVRLTRDGFHSDAQAFALPGDDDVFTVESPQDALLAYVESGSALSSGRLVIIMVVWCSVLGEYVTMRALVGRKMVDTVSEPSVAETEEMLKAVQEMASAINADEAYPRTNLVFSEKNPASNGRCSWMATTTYSSRNTLQFRQDLNDGLGNSAEMLKANRKAIKAAAKADNIPLDQLDELCARDDRVAAQARRAVADAANKCRDSVPKTTPTARFDAGMVRDFKAFAKAVGKQLNLTGCWRRPKPKKKKRRRAPDFGPAPAPAPVGPPPVQPHQPPAPAPGPAPATPAPRGPPRQITTPEGQRLVDALYNTNQPPANAPPTLHGAAAAAQAAQSSQTG